MPGVRSHLGSRRNMRICRETNWAECPGAPTWYDVPILEDGMKLKAVNNRYIPNTNFQGWKQPCQVCHFQEVSGDLVTHPWVEQVDFLMDMVLERMANPADDNYQDVYSYCLDHYTPDDPRRYLGAVVETLTIAATGTGDADVRLTLSLRAKSEAENDALTEGDFDYSDVSCVPFMFAHAAILLDGNPVTDVEAFTIAIENNVQQGPNSGGYVAYLIAGRRTISLELTELNNCDAFNQAIRGCGEVSFQATFTHPSGSTWDIELPVLYVSESDEDGTPDASAKENPRMTAATDESDDDIISTVDVVPVTTTTTVAPTTTTTVAPTTTTTVE